METSEIANRFYNAFADKNAEAMATFYHPQASFSDPVFQNLDVGEARQMWRMLCSKKESDLQISYKILSAQKSTVNVEWQARYVFSKTGRRVVNNVSSVLEIRDDKNQKTAHQSLEQFIKLQERQETT